MLFHAILVVPMAEPTVGYSTSSQHLPEYSRASSKNPISLLPDLSHDP